MSVLNEGCRVRVTRDNRTRLNIVILEHDHIAIHVFSGSVQDILVDVCV